MAEALNAELDGGSAPDGVRRPPPTVRELVEALHLLAARFDGRSDVPGDAAAAAEAGAGGPSSQPWLVLALDAGRGVAQAGWRATCLG